MCVFVCVNFVVFLLFFLVNVLVVGVVCLNCRFVVKMSFNRMIRSVKFPFFKFST